VQNLLTLEPLYIHGVYTEQESFTRFLESYCRTFSWAALPSGTD